MFLTGQVEENLKPEPLNSTIVACAVVVAGSIDNQFTHKPSGNTCKWCLHS